MAVPKPLCCFCCVCCRCVVVTTDLLDVRIPHRYLEQFIPHCHYQTLSYSLLLTGPGIVVEPYLVCSVRQTSVFRWSCNSVAADAVLCPRATMLLEDSAIV